MSDSENKELKGLDELKALRRDEDATVRELLQKSIHHLELIIERLANNDLLLENRIKRSEEDIVAVKSLLEEIRGQLHGALVTFAKDTSQLQTSDKTQGRRWEVLIGIGISIFLILLNLVIDFMTH